MNPLNLLWALFTPYLDALRDFIDEHLAMGFIRPSNSLFGVPVLFVKKKDSVRATAESDLAEF